MVRTVVLRRLVGDNVVYAIVEMGDPALDALQDNMGKFTDTQQEKIRSGSRERCFRSFS